VPARQIEHPHAALQREYLGEALREVEGVLTERVGLGPGAIVALGQGKESIGCRVHGGEVLHRRSERARVEAS
jgi:hypothetical protein